MTDALIAVCSALLGAVFMLNAFLLARVYGNQRDHSQKLSATDKDVQGVRVLVAESYVKREDLEKTHREMMDRLARFEERIDAVLARLTQRTSG